MEYTDPLNGKRSLATMRSQAGPSSSSHRYPVGAIRFACREIEASTPARSRAGTSAIARST